MEYIKLFNLEGRLEKFEQVRSLEPVAVLYYLR